MNSAPNATATPNENGETVSLEEHTYINDISKFLINISFTGDQIVFDITDIQEHNVPSRKYVNQFTLEDLLMKSKLFKMFDDISETQELFKHILTSNSFTIKKSCNCVLFNFHLNSFNSEEILLEISQQSLNQDVAMNGLCRSVANLNKRYIDYQKKYEHMKQHVEILETRMERIIIEKKEMEDGWKQKLELKEKEIAQLKEDNKLLTSKIKKLSINGKKLVIAVTKVKTEDKQEITQDKK